MITPVSIENDDLQMEIWPQFGGKVSAIIDKADGFNLLFNYPDELPTRSRYDASYAGSWHAGWDECFPALAPGPYIGHPYDGIAVPDHGELWGLPTTAVPTNSGITTVWNGLRFGYRLTRKLYLDGPSIAGEYKLTNLTPFPFHFVWAMHAMFAMEQPVELRPEPGAYQWTHDHESKPIERPFDWPQVAEGEDLSRPATLPPKRGWKAYSQQPISQSASIRFLTRKRQVQIDYGSEDGPQAHWGVWVDTGGWAAQRQCSIQPTIGRHDQLATAIRDGSCGSLDPSGVCEWSIRLTVGPMV